MFASARAIGLHALDLLLPKERENVSNYAAKNRKLDNRGGGHQGDWDNKIAPYLVKPMNALTDPRYLTVCLVKPGQCGGTSIAENWLQHTVERDPADMLWFMQTDQALQPYVKKRIDGMIDLHPKMKARIGKRPIDNSIHFKKFVGMSAEFLSATPANLINKSAPRLVMDEVDSYDAGIGDVKANADIRRQTYKRRSKLFVLSHPDRARGMNPKRDWTDGITAIYSDSDQQIWYWRCPICSGYSSPFPLAARYMFIDYPPDGTLDEVEKNARLICPCNGCIVGDEFRHAMNQTGLYVGLGQEISEAGKVTGELVRRDTAGFWIVGAMSPFIIGGIGGLARARVKAEREMEITGEDMTVKTVMTRQWGIPHNPKAAVGELDANVLADRSDKTLKLGRVPPGVRFLVIVADVQGSHFEFLVRGFGVKGESWVIDKGKVLAETTTSGDDWDALIERLQKSYPLDDGTGRHMLVRASGYDSQGAPGVTQQAYSAWTRARKARKAKFYGKIGGREAWSLIPLRGLSGINAQRLAVNYPDTNRQANLKAGSGNVPVAMFNPNSFKDDVSGMLQCAEEGPLYVHFPAELKSKEPPHYWFEQLTAEQRLPNGRWEKIHNNLRNETWDLFVMSNVVAHLHGLSRIDWTKPPAWADSWEKNPLVVAPDKVPGYVAPGKTKSSGEVKITTEGAGKGKTLASKLA